MPKAYLNGHTKKIFTLDFSPIKENHLASSSADGTIKMWSCDVGNGDNDKKPRWHAFNVFHANTSPVWKLKFTPFGEGLVTLDASHMSNNLMLWSASRSHNKGPVHKFYNHADAVQGILDVYCVVFK